MLAVIRPEQKQLQYVECRGRSWILMTGQRPKGPEPFSRIKAWKELRKARFPLDLRP